MTTEQRILQIEAELGALKADLAKQAPTMERQDEAYAWEILEFKEKNGAGLIDASFLSTRNIHQYDIWKVRRLSDGTVWTVGDAFRLPDHNLTEKIEAFITKGDLISVDATRIMSPLALLIKPAHLFTTADGVKLYDNNQIVYSLSIWGANFTGNISEGPAACIADWKRAYSTRLAAEKAYNAWLADQPVLSLNDISRFIDIGPYCELEALVKDKIAKR